MLRLVTTGGLTTALFIWIIAFMSVGAGHGVATNSSLSYEEVRTNVTNSVQDAESDVYANRSDVQERGIRASPAGSLLELFDVIFASGFDFGYHHPVAADWYLRLSPVAVLGGCIAYAYGLWREMRRKL